MNQPFIFKVSITSNYYLIEANVVLEHNKICLVVMCMARPKAGKPGQPGLRCLSQARPWGVAL